MSQSLSQHEQDAADALESIAQIRPSQHKSTSSSTRGGHGKRVTRIVFTLNNYSSEEFEKIKLIGCKWMIVARETGDMNDTPHLQGAIIFNSQKAFSTLKKIPGLERAHFEEMKGSPQQSLDYCTKQDKEAFQIGTLPTPGKRNDMEAVVNKLKEGVTIKKLVEDTSSAICFVRYSRGLTLLRQQYTPLRDPTKPPTIIWFYGPTGVNKTRACFELSTYQEKTAVPWISSGPLKWFDGYDSQSIVIFDDLRTSDCSFSYLLRLLDRYPLQVEFKGGHSTWNPSTIFITCPKSPRDLWSLRTTEQLDQLSRRVTRELEFPPSREQFLGLSEILLISSGELNQIFDVFWPSDTSNQISIPIVSQQLVVGGDGQRSGLSSISTGLASSTPERDRLHNRATSSSGPPLSSSTFHEPNSGNNHGLNTSLGPTISDNEFGWPDWDDLDDPEDPFIKQFF